MSHIPKLQEQEKKTYREHEQHPLKISEFVLESRGRGRADTGGEVQKQNPILVVMVITDSPPLEPLSDLFSPILILNAEIPIQVSGPEHVRVDHPVEQLGRNLGSSANESDHHYAAIRRWV